MRYFNVMVSVGGGAYTSGRKRYVEAHSVKSLAEVLRDKHFQVLPTRKTAWIAWPGIPMSARSTTNSTIYSLEAVTGSEREQEYYFDLVEKERKA